MRKFAFAAIMTVFFFGCVSSPSKAPEWALKIPAPDSSYTYFVGFGTDPAGSEVTAIEIASTKLVQEIMNYIGVTVTSDTTATARASLESYQASLVSTLKSSASNRISGFVITEKFTAKMRDSKQIQAYVLGRYLTLDLEREKKRIQADFQKKIDAVAVPEQEGRRLLSEGRPFDAVRKFAEAASAASKSDIANASIYFEDNINLAKEALGKARFLMDGKPVQANLGQAFPSPFTGRIVFGEDRDAAGIPGANIAVSYPQKQASGRIISKTENILSDSAGRFSFLPPVPEYIGKQKITFRLDLRDSLTPLRDVGEKYQALKSSFTEAVSQKYADVEFTVGSAARTVSMGVSIVDLDESGVFVAGSTCQTGLLESLTKEKFKVKAVTLSRDSVMALDEDAILAAARTGFGQQIERIAFGTAKITGVKKDGSNFIASGVAEIRVIDLKTGDTIYSKQVTSMTVDSTEALARKAAYRDLGFASVGKDMTNSLP